jgi:hypothetical protein
VKKLINPLIKISKYVKNSKYPSKHSRDVFPEIGNTGVISVRQ